MVGGGNNMNSIFFFPFFASIFLSLIAMILIIIMFRIREVVDLNRRLGIGCSD
jgi:hypothetical protein